MKQLECATLGLVARLYQARQRLLAQRVLLLGYDAALARLHQILALEATARMLGRAVPHLRLRAHRHRGRRRLARHLTRRATRRTTLAEETSASVASEHSSTAVHCNLLRDTIFLQGSL